MSRIIKIAVLAAIAILATAAVASASVNVTNGIGFVGKGDVQNALGGMNNAAIQNLVDSTNGVTFTYTTTDTYNVVEEWTTGPDKNRKEHQVTKTTTHNVNAAVDSDARKVKGQKQWTGFILHGFVGDPIVSGDKIPSVDDIVVGDPQDEGGNTDHRITEVTLASSTGGLFVHGNGMTAALPNTAL